MTSLKDILRSGKPSAADYVQSLQTVLAGISRYTTGGQDDELAAFRDTLLRLAREVREQSRKPEIDEAVEVSLEQLRVYNERTAEINAGHLAELKSALRTMTETVSFLSESRTRSVHQLHFVEREMEQAAQLGDLRLLRARLTDCLNMVREETVRLQGDSESRPIDVSALVASPVQSQSSNRFGTMDIVTGLPARKAAENAIAGAIAAGQEGAAALFVVNRMPGINARYGRAIGDEVMLRVANHFAQNLPHSTSLYRWSGPALVALAEAEENYAELKAAWTKTAAVKHEMSLDSLQRSVFVMVETSLNVYRVKRDISTQELFRMLDSVVAGYIEAEAPTK